MLLGEGEAQPETVAAAAWRNAAAIGRAAVPGEVAPAAAAKHAVRDRKSVV